METCTQCSSQFKITEEDKKFYKDLEVPSPSKCPECRLIRRLQKTYYNQMKH